MFTGNLFVSACFAVPCPDCRVPQKDCIVCQAYRKVYGRDFLKYRFERGPHHRTTSTPAFRSFASEPTKLRARLPTDDLLNESHAYSEPIPRGRRIFPHDVDQYGSYLESLSHGINDRMKSLTKGHATTSPMVSTDSSHLCQWTIIAVLSSLVYTNTALHLPSILTYKRYYLALCHWVG